MTWLPDVIPNESARAAFVGARLVDVAAALFVAADDTEAQALSDAVEWRGHLPCREVAGAASALLAGLVAELSDVTGEPPAALFTRLRRSAAGLTVTPERNTQP